MTSSIKPTTLISLNLPSHLKDILDQYSRSTNISKTYLIRYLLEQHLSRYQGMGHHDEHFKPLPIYISQQEPLTMKHKKYITTIPTKISIPNTDNGILINIEIQYETYTDGHDSSIETTKLFLDEEKSLILKQSLVNIRSKINQVLRDDPEKTSDISFQTDKIISSTNNRIKTFKSYVVSQRG